MYKSQNFARGKFLGEYGKRIGSDGWLEILNQETGNTLLIDACRKKDFEKVQIILELKADVNAEGANAVTALQMAVFKGATKIVKLLIDSQADINSQNKDTNTALHIAASGEGCDMNSIIELLINSKADTTIKGNHGFTPLERAKHYANVDVAILLIKLCPQDKIIESEKESTPPYLKGLGEQPLKIEDDNPKLGGQDAYSQAE